MSPSIWQILMVVVLLLLLFGGRGKISSIMGDLASGIKSFRSGLSEEDEEKEKEKSAPRSIPDHGETIDMSPSGGKAKDKSSSSS